MLPSQKSNLQLAESDILRFRTAVARRFGLAFEEARLPWLGEALQRRLVETGPDVGAYLLALEAGVNPGEDAALAQTLTIGETYFFRHIEQYRALAEVGLRRPGRRAGPPRLLSAGCSSGEEAYSLAMVIRDEAPDLAESAEVIGVDLNPAALQAARQGCYAAWSLRETSPEARARWFLPRTGCLVVHPEIRQSVRFISQNLVENTNGLWDDDRYDAIFCRNVLMYFTREAARAVVSHIETALRDEGLLFLGAAETLRDLSTRFELVHSHGAFYYQLHKDPSRRRTAAWPAAEETDRSAPPAPPMEMPSLADLLSALDGDPGWATTAPGAFREDAPPDAGHPHDADRPAALRQALGLLQAERFEEVEAVLAEVAPEDDTDPDLLLLRATLNIQRGRFAVAEGLCRRLLEGNQHDPGAHYLLALCREGLGDRADAARQDEIALYLDPSFAMARLHLGALARKAGDHAAAAREFEEAALLLRREDLGRLLLFGGGFGREALIRLCEAAVGPKEGGRR